jgi:hypothetical protein
MKQKAGKKRQAPPAKSGPTGNFKKAKRQQKSKKNKGVPTGRPEANFRYVTQEELKEKYADVKVPQCQHGTSTLFGIKQR